MATATSGHAPNTSSEPFAAAAAALSQSAASSALAAVPRTSPALEPGAAQPGSRKTHSPQSDAGRSTTSVKSTYAPPTSRPALTGAAVMADARKRKQHQLASPSRETSPNPAAQVMQSLLGTSAMSKPSDAPDPEKVGLPLQRLAQKIQVPDSTQAQADTTHVTSPSISSSFGMGQSITSGPSLTATADDPSPTDQHAQFVAEPGEMAGAEHHQQHGGTNGTAGGGDDGPKAFTYPGPQPPSIVTPGSSRRMSLPGYGQSSPKSPPSGSTKRHKCPYCSTEFTRHHNLKSHLLTHSQEKPYVCQTCPARFRRLHDLKRHTKLHTGERPHTCDKCGRRFARGDALARHNKGPGGCAGARRSSFGGDDDFAGDGAGGDTMDGIEYADNDNDDDDDEGAQSGDHGRRVSEPHRKRTHIETPYDASRDVYRQQSSTYPPMYAPPQPRPHGPQIALPPVVLHNSDQVASPREMNSYPSPAPGGSTSVGQSYYNPQPTGNVFQQSGGMIDSPKPLSPGHPPDSQQQRLGVSDVSMSSAINRNRSPSLSTQLQQAHFGRGSGARSPPNAASHLPVLPPLGSGSNQPPGAGSARSGLSQPSISASGPPGSNALHTSTNNNTSISSSNTGTASLPTAAPISGPPQASNPNSMSSHGHRSSGGSVRDVFGPVATAQGSDAAHGELWSYVRSLEARFSRMQDEYELRISRLQEEVITLRGQVAASTAASASAPGSLGQSGPSGTYSGDIPQPRY